jgi:hypothetical protein
MRLLYNKMGVVNKGSIILNPYLYKLLQPTDHQKGIEDII